MIGSINSRRNVCTEAEDTQMWARRDTWSLFNLRPATMQGNNITAFSKYGKGAQWHELAVTEASSTQHTTKAPPLVRPLLTFIHLIGCHFKKPALHTPCNISSFLVTWQHLKSLSTVRILSITFSNVRPHFTRIYQNYFQLYWNTMFSVFCHTRNRPSGFSLSRNLRVPGCNTGQKAK